MANSRWPPVGRRFAGARSQFASAAAAQSREETALEASGARSRSVERNGLVPSGLVAVTGHQGDPEPVLRSLRPRACCQNESGVDAGRAESGLESGVLLSPESGVWLGRQRAALMAKWRKCPDFLLAAGGHFPMAADRELAIPSPDVNLAIGSGTHGAQSGAMFCALEDAFIRFEPDCVLAYEDTNLTLAATIASVKLHIPLAHLEAGLRSFNRRMPEEHNRVLTDHAAARTVSRATPWRRESSRIDNPSTRSSRRIRA